MQAFVGVATAGTVSGKGRALMLSPRTHASRGHFVGQRVPMPVVSSSGPPHVGASGIHMTVTVKVNEGEPVESAIRRFKKEVLKSGHLMEVRKRRYFVSNSEKRQVMLANHARKARISQLQQER